MMSKIKIGNVEMKVKSVGTEFKWDSERNTYRVTLKNDNGNKYAFKFYDSIYNTENDIGLTDTLVSNIIETIIMDYNCTTDNYPTFESFCNEFGYDEYDSEHKKLYKTCIKHGDKLNTVIDDSFIDSYETYQELAK